MKKERLVNIRFLFCIFAGLMLGIVTNRLFLFKKINLFFYILLILFFAGIMVFSIIYANKTSSYNKMFKHRKNLSFILRSSGIGFFVAFVVGIIITISPLLNIVNINTLDDKAVSLTGVVCDYVDEEETYTKFVVGDCVCINENSESIQLKYKVVIYTSIYVDINLGDEIVLKNIQLENFEYNSDYELTQLSQGIGYSTYVESKSIEFGDNNISLKDNIHNKVKECLNNNLNKDNSDISFAIMFGQKHGLSKNISEMFSYAGISHILAVSGLHVSVLVSVIWFMLNKIKMNRYAKLVLFGSILLFYSYLCLFSPSVCRASIMAIVLALCKTFGWEYDILSSLSIAGIFILLISPMSLFTLSFQLSFLCIFAIITLAPAINKLFDKIKLPKVLASSLSMSISVTIAILPVCMNSFSTVSLLGILANIIVLPIFTITYVLLFTILLLSLIFRPLGVLLAFPNFFLHIIKVVANYVSLIPFGIFKVFRASYVLLVIMSVAFLTIHFWLLKKWWKGGFVSALFLISFVMLIVYSIPKTYENGSLIIAEQNSSNAVIYVEDNETILIGSNISCDNLTYIMKDIKLKKIDTIIAYDFQYNNVNELLKIKDNFGVSKVLIPDKYLYTEIIECIGDVEKLDVQYSTNYLKLESVVWGDDIIAITCDVFGNKSLIPSLENNSAETEYLRNRCKGYDLYIIDNYENWEKHIPKKNLLNITDTDTIVVGV